jgi:aspartyl-tRNA synthetase
MKRTHHCAELDRSAAGRTVTLSGWIDSVRDHGGIFFVDLRDREGLTQIVFDPANEGLKNQFHALKPESVISVTGKVTPREEGTVNQKIPTGAIEVHASELKVENIAKTPPFPMDENGNKVNEDLRLTHRYLDLRRPTNLDLMKLRHRAAQATRRFLDSEGFLEVETPMLFKSTPEGAREFLVPSRVNPGEFYALPQSPQQFKQMLMVAGVEKYYQLAKCFRDEDLRADRQLEFTQIDLEMSFIDREDMYSLIEGLMQAIWKDTLGVNLSTPFPRMGYFEAMDRFGVDKPDLRFGLEIQDFSKDFNDSGFKVFKGALDSGGVVKAFNAKGLADVTQGEMKALEESAKTMGAKGLAFIKVQNGEWKSPILKFFSEFEKSALQERLRLEDGDIVFFAATHWLEACHILGRVRLDCARLLEKRGLLERRWDDWRFLWVIEFPLMVYDEDVGRYASAHHPFTSPVEEDIPLLDSDQPEDIKKVRGQHYDLVLNGWELGGGSIRIHQPELQMKVFKEVLQLPEETIQDRFGYMLRAFEFGAPPHGGMAFGFDRLCTLLGNRSSIRDVMAFPKTQKAQDLMAGAPAEVTEKQLRDLHIRVVKG